MQYHVIEYNYVGPKPRMLDEIEKTSVLETKIIEISTAPNNIYGRANRFFGQNNWEIKNHGVFDAYKDACDLVYTKFMGKIDKVTLRTTQIEKSLSLSTLYQWGKPPKPMQVDENRRTAKLAKNKWASELSVKACELELEIVHTYQKAAKTYETIGGKNAAEIAAHYQCMATRIIDMRLGLIERQKSLEVELDREAEMVIEAALTEEEVS